VRSNSGDRSVVSLFSGAGGLDLGLEKAGWRIVAHVEMHPDCVGTLQKQSARLQRGSRLVCAKIEDVDPGDLRRTLKLRRGELDLLAGGPPCQPFTTTGLRQAISDRRVASAFPTYLAYVAQLRPRMLLMENVDGMLSAALKHRPLKARGKESPALRWEERKGSFLHWLLTELAKLDYSVAWGVCEAAEHGVPQLRQRAMLIGVREDSPCFLPPATHGSPGRPEYLTLRKALRGIKVLGPIQPLSERKKAVFKLIPAGGNWRDLSPTQQAATMGAAFHADGGKSGWWRRLAWDEPAPTILGMPDHSSTALIHPDEVRCLSLNECAAVQTFPKWVKFAGSPRSQYQQVGNAVPPRLAERLGNWLAQYLEGTRPIAPGPPEWKKASANRRIGTHGWSWGGGETMNCRLIGKLREDHVWADRQQELQFG